MDQYEEARQYCFDMMSAYLPALIVHVLRFCLCGMLELKAGNFLKALSVHQKRPFLVLCFAYMQLMGMHTINVANLPKLTLERAKICLYAPTIAGNVLLASSSTPAQTDPSIALNTGSLWESSRACPSEIKRAVDIILIAMPVRPQQ